MKLDVCDMVKIRLENFKREDGSIYLPRPKVYLDGFCYEYNSTSIESKLEVLAYLVDNGLDLVSEVKTYMEERSPVTLSSLKFTLVCYIQMLNGVEPEDFFYCSLNEMPEIRLAAMLQEELTAHRDDFIIKELFL